MAKISETSDKGTVIETLRQKPEAAKIALFAAIREGEGATDAGILLLRKANRRLGLLAALDSVLTDPRDPLLITHPQVDLFGWLDYGASSWDKPRRVILKAEHTDQGQNPRYLVTNLEGDARSLYEETYCARGDGTDRREQTAPDAVPGVPFDQWGLGQCVQATRPSRKNAAKDAKKRKKTANNPVLCHPDENCEISGLDQVNSIRMLVTGRISSTVVEMQAS